VVGLLREVISQEISHGWFAWQLKVSNSGLELSLVGLRGSYCGLDEIAKLGNLRKGLVEVRA
jgi:hypothetical protein